MTASASVDVPEPAGDAPVSIEHALVVRARSGDAEAFRGIFNRYARPVWRFLRDLLGEDAAADEGTQETFVRAFRLLAGLREADRLSSWLFGIARNVSLEQMRARRRQRAGCDEAAAGLPDHAPTPEAALLGQESERLLGAALARLREDRRAALLLRIDHGLPYEDIATTMGWSLPKVKNEIHRARLELRAHLSGYVGGEA